MVSDNKFELISEYTPQGDQPEAVRQLVEGTLAGKKHQTLLGATGTGKTFTIAHTIAKLGRPTLVIAHNKTLAAQLASEFREFFPNNSVDYFVSYCDYYQPEAYLPPTPISRKIPALMKKSINYVTRRRARCLSGGMLSSWRACRVFTVSVPRWSIAIWYCRCG